MGARRGILIGSVVAWSAAACGDPPTRQDAVAVASVVVAPSNPTLRFPGDTLRLRAKALDSSGATLASVTFTWSSSDTATVRVSASGLVTAVALGCATVTATSGPVSGSATVAVVEQGFLPIGGGITAGGKFACALTPRGAAYCWGANNAAQLGNGMGGGAQQMTPVAVSGGLAFTEIRAGEMRACALTEDGAAYCWGRFGTHTNIPAPTPVSDTLRFRSLVAGRAHNCGITAGGAVFCWGYNEFGQFGDGAATLWRDAPVLAARGQHFIALAAGAGHTCGLTATGTAFCWGSNAYGQLGDGTTTDRARPVAVAGGLTFTSITAGMLHTCGLTTSGAVFCWGYNSNGQLGDNTGIGRLAPTPVDGGRSFTSLTAGQIHTCALTAAGEAYCWGDDQYGQVGDSLLVNRASPVPVAGGRTFAALSAGWTHTCGITPSGAAYCWGADADGQLGDGAGGRLQFSPVPVAGGLDFAQVAAGGGNTACGVTTSGSAYCWGAGRYGQLGDGWARDRADPGPVAGGLTFEMVSVGDFHTCGVTTDGRAYCWGSNGSGQIGDGTAGDASVPAPVSGGLTFRTISAGQSRTCGVTSGGSAYCWGANASGQLGDGTTTASRVPAPVSGNLTFTAINTGTTHTCGVATGGAAYCWGGNADGQLGNGTTTASSVPVPVSGGLTFRAVNAGWVPWETATCGLTTSGAAYCWGHNGLGTLGNTAVTGSSSIVPVPVSGGLTFQSMTVSCALTAAGKTYCWGLGWYGRFADGSTTNHDGPEPGVQGLTLRAISMTRWFACGITFGGAAYCWGNNNNGELGDGRFLRWSPAPVGGGIVFAAGRQRTARRGSRRRRDTPVRWPRMAPPTAGAATVTGSWETRHFRPAAASMSIATAGGGGSLGRSAED